MKKVLINKVGNVKVYLVNGEEVRGAKEIDFTNFAQHYRFPDLIPEDEWWIDNNTEQAEWPFYIAHLQKEYDLMVKGAPYQKAIVAADAKEKAERQKAGLKVSSHLKKQPIKLNYKKLWQTIQIDSGLSVKVFLIDGEELRDKSGNLDFVDGGHGLVYHYIKEDEIFIEKALSKDEREFILLHELTEWSLMKYKHMSYEKAHQQASKVELKARQESLKGEDND